MDRREPTTRSRIIKPARRVDENRRQETSAAASSTFNYFASSSGASSSGTSSANPLFVGPSTTASSAQYYNASSVYEPNTTYYSSDTHRSTSQRTSTYSPTTTFTSLWTYSASRTATATATSPSQSVYVPGTILNLTLAAASDTEAVYSVEMAFGHSSSDNSKRKRRRDTRSSSDWDGGDPQVVNMQIDLGSSDMWVAADTCTSSACTSASHLFNTSQSIDSGTSSNLTYESGAVDGNVFWEEVVVGDFGIAYQAFIAADTVTNEDLSGGNFTGVLGLAMPAASTILDTIGGTTGSSPDGATFLDNLFGSGSSAPTQRLFTLSLARLEDVRTSSSFGIGAISSSYCPSPCSPTYTPIIAQPSLGTTGYLHWRVQVQGVSATTWSDAQHGTGATTNNVTLGASEVYPSKSSPLAVLDSGGVQILVGYRPYADAIYSAYGISMSSDGYYRMPCTTQIALTFTIAGVQIPVHPLDMTYVDPTDQSQSTCIGMIQYSSGLGDTGDFILGSAFMKNVYTIFQYPDVNKQVTWQPTVGFVPLTNASVASQDFYAVRSLHQSLASVSSSQQATSGGTVTGNTGTSTSAASAASTKKVVSTAIIAAVSVVGFFVLAAALFCAWWFWLRRKFGAAGVVEYKPARKRPGAVGHDSDLSTSSSRHKKHEETLRQKSMIEGYSDYEGDSWMSTTEGNDSIRLGYIPEVAEEDEAGWASRGADRRSSRASSARASSTNRDIGVSEQDRGIPLVDLTQTTSRDRIRSPRQAQLPLYNEVEPFSPPLHSETHPLAAAGPYPYPQPTVAPSNRLGSSTSGRSLSMAGPFPTSNNRQSTQSIATSPMYDIRASDYFNIPSGSTAASAAAVVRGRRMSNNASNVANVGDQREASYGRRRSSPSKGVFVDSPLDEEHERSGM